MQRKNTNNIRGNTTKTYYIRDPQGNVMSIYTLKEEDNPDLVDVLDVVSESDYFPFGMMLTNRNGEAFEALQKLTNEKLILLKDGQVVSYNAMAAKLTEEQKNDPAILGLVESYVTPVEQDIQDLNSGTTLVNNLLTDDNTVAITESEKGKNGQESHTQSASSDGTGSNSTPDTATANSETGALNKNYEPTPNYIGLGHELIHADHTVKGNKIPKDTHKYVVAPERITKRGDFRPEYIWSEAAPAEELRTVGLSNEKEGDITENDLRKEHNLNKRTTYNLPK